ncbi:MAG: SUMF1/EgtB/PvdO family nonheme iron enzyme [Fibrobacteria bacterium]|nr:SUMF1/EgtB/PvdO family nonheme iron enzyme [Fibrobacteria bacterium]
MSLFSNILPLFCLFFLACENRYFDNPVDPESAFYVNEQLASDTNNNNIADGLEPDMASLSAGCYQTKTLDSSFEICLQGFLLQKTELTEGEYRTAIQGYIPEPETDSLPITGISWFDAIAYCNRLSTIHKLDKVYIIQDDSVYSDISKNGFRLPTETEWEYAYGAGEEGKYYWEGDSTGAKNYSWFSENAEGQLHAIGQKKPNANGLYDMSGNALEWVHDWYGVRTLDKSWAGADSGIQRIAKGGSFFDKAIYLERNNRQALRPIVTRTYLGFRLARTTEN